MVNIKIINIRFGYYSTLTREIIDSCDDETLIL